MLLKQFSKYVIIGILNTLFGYASYMVLILVGLSPIYSLVIAASIGFIFNYNTTGRVVFRNKSWRPMFRYAVASIALLLINAGLLKFIIGFGVNPLLAQAACLLFSIPTGYFFMRWWVFPARN